MAAPNLRRLTPRAHLALALVGTFLSACAGEGDVDRVQPDAIDKTIFLKEDGSPRLFYYRETMTGMPPTSAYAFEGMMGDMLKVRFDIQEKFLVGYRAYDFAPGSQNPNTGGANNTDTPALIYAIQSHFDIKREYNPATGEETNVISENTSDRPWNDRQYMRVDWSRNQAVPLENVDPMDAFLSGQKTNGIAIGENEESLFNPNRPIFTRDYIDFSHREIRSPDILACYRLFGGDDEIGPWGCGDAEITFRNSLMPVPDTEYEPLSFPDRQILRDDKGKPLRMAWGADGPIACTSAALKREGLTGEDCTEASLDQFSKFGYFRTAVPTYDRQVGATQEGRQYFANRWNIWQETIQKGADGKPLLRAMDLRSASRTTCGRRGPSPTTSNPEFPDGRPAARGWRRSPSADWNDAMKETVAALALTANGQPDAVADAAEDAREVAARHHHAAAEQLQPEQRQDVRRDESRRPFDGRGARRQPRARLRQPAGAGSAEGVHGARGGDPEPQGRRCAPKFTWQRNGDLRYSFLHWVDRPQVAGPLGYGPSSQDPETGEIVSAAAYIYGAALDTYAKFATDSVRLANGQLSTDDLLSGKTISDVLKESSAAASARAKETMSDAAKDHDPRARAGAGGHA